MPRYSTRSESDPLPSLGLDSVLEDVRHIQGLPSSSPSSAISYQRSFDHLPDDPFANCIWPNDAPPKCLFFLWETHHQKLNTNCRLNRRGSDNDGPCPFCAASEDVPHLFLHCPRSLDFWSSIGLSTANILSVELLGSVEFPGPPFPNQRSRSNILTALLWSIWKCRNAKIFQGELESNATILRRCTHDLSLWSNRCIDDWLCIDDWINFLCNLG